MLNNSSQRENLENLDKFFKRSFIRNRMKSTIRFLIPQKPDVKLIFGIGGGSHTNGENIVVGYPEVFHDFSRESATSISMALLGHEAQHVVSSSFKGYEKFHSDVYSFLNGKYGYSKGLSSQIACGFGNAIEDGRIENILVSKNPGFLNKIKFLNVSFWNASPVKPEEEFEDISLKDFLHAINSLSALGIFPKGFKKHYRKTKGYKILREMQSEINRGIMAKTCLEALSICYDLIVKYSDYIDILVQKLRSDMMDEIEELLSILGMSEESFEGCEDIESNSSETIVTHIITESSESEGEENEEPKESASSGSCDGQENEEEDNDEENTDSSGGSGKKDSSDEKDSEDNVGDSGSSDDSENKDSDDNSDSPDNSGNPDNSDNSNNSDGDDDSDSSTDSNDSESSDNSSKADDSDSSDISGKSDNSQDSFELNNKEGKQNQNQEGESIPSSGKDLDSSIDTDDLAEEMLDEFKREASLELGDMIQESDKHNKAEEDKKARELEGQLADQKDIDDISERALKEESLHYGFKEMVPEPEKRPLPLELRGPSNRFRREIDKILKGKETHNKSNQARGILDTNSLYRIALDDYDIFKQKGQSQLRDYVGYVLLDGSGSMMGRKETSSSAAVSVIEEGLKQFIPLKITQFHTSNYDDTVLHHVIKTFDQKEKSHNYTTSFFGEHSAGGGNKDGFSIRVATSELLRRPEQDRILIILSDGMPTDYAGGSSAGRKDVQLAVKEARNKGILVITIMFGDNAHFFESNREFYEEMYEKNIIGCVPENIIPQLTSLLKKIIKS